MLRASANSYQCSFCGTSLGQTNAHPPGESLGHQGLPPLLLLGGKGASRARQVFNHSGPSFLGGDHSKLGKASMQPAGLPWVSCLCGPLSFLRSPRRALVLPRSGPLQGKEHPFRLSPVTPPEQGLRDLSQPSAVGGGCAPSLVFWNH